MPGDTNISSEAVENATGRPWSGWFELLDDWGAAKRAHPEIASHLAEVHGLSPWWSQMVTVEYERRRGMREVGQTADGSFQMGAQRTTPTSVADLWDSVMGGDGLVVWLGDGAPPELVEGDAFELANGTRCEVRVVRPGSHVRLAWWPPDWDRHSTLQVRINEASGDRGVVSVHHEGLPSAKVRDRMKEHWKAVLGRLVERG